MEITVVTTIELPQSDGVPVKEKIIQFLQKRLTRTEAETIYDLAHGFGAKLGVKAFDDVIQCACDNLELDSNELVQLIHGTQLS
jgi:hypothetical protein